VVHQLHAVALTAKFGNNALMTANLNNPYAPPTEVTEPPWSLPPDTEFLFNDEVIAAVGTLTLPKVCVLTGRKTLLIQRTTTLRAAPFWHVMSAVIVSFGLIAFFAGFLWAFDLQPNAVAPWNVSVVLAVSCSIGIVLFRRRRLQLTWYIADSQFWPLERREAISKLVSAGLAIFAFIGWLIGIVPLSFEIILVIGISLIPWMRGTQVLTSSGCYNGLVLVTGFKPPFINELRRMIEAHEEKSLNSSEDIAPANKKQTTPRFETFPS
jgi:hypothetical protein